MSARRVVVTGMGVMASNARSVPELWEALQRGRSGIRESKNFGEDGRVRAAGEVDLPEPRGSTEDRVSRLALHAAEEAVGSAGLGLEHDAWRSAGVMVGTSRGPALSLERFMGATAPEARRTFFQEVPFHSIARNVARRFGLGGIHSTVTMACVSSSLAIGRAMDEIRRGRARLMLAGGTDALTPLSFSGFSVLRAMSRTRCRPFDRRRDGMHLGEGAGMVVLEERRHALARGAQIHAELCGWASAGDAHHPTSPHPQGRGLKRAMELALRQAQLTAESVEFINLHGTGTPANDPAECHAVHQLFGQRAAKVPVNSLKPFFGHTLGASGVLEFIGSLVSVRHDFLPPTLNCEELDAECALDVVRGQGRSRRVEVFMSTKSAFGGANVALVARRGPEAG